MTTVAVTLVFVLACGQASQQAASNIAAPGAGAGSWSWRELAESHILRNEGTTRLVIHEIDWR